MRSVLILLTFLVLTVSAHAEKKVALIIGNQAYQHLSELRNGSHGAVAISGAFERLGFDVTLIRNAGASTLRSGLAQFAKRAGDADISVVYFAGHGIQINGETYIIPSDARLKNVVVVGFELISLDSIVSTLQWTRGLKIFFLDMCGGNGFKRIMNTGATSHAIGCGLASMEPEAGTVVSYAGRTDTRVESDADRFTPYTGALLKYLEQPELDLRELFVKVRNDVMRTTANLQEPFILGSVPKYGYRLLPAVPATTVGPIASKRDEAARAWHLIRDTGDRDVVEAYLHEFGESSKFYALLAGKRLADIERNAGTPVSDAEVPLPGGRLDEKRGTTNVVDAVARMSEPKPLRAARIVAQEGIGSTSALQVSLSRSIQAELNRIGCSAGTPDGVWGKRSRGAMRAYLKNAGTALASLEPNAALLARLRGEVAGTCRVGCMEGLVPLNGHCVAKTCPAGQMLSSNGECRVERRAKSVAPCTIAPRRNSIGECVSSRIKVSKAAGSQVERKRPRSDRVRTGKANSFKQKGVTGYTPGFCYQSARNLC